MTERTANNSPSLKKGMSLQLQDPMKCMFESDSCAHSANVPATSHTIRLAYSVRPAHLHFAKRLPGHASEHDDASKESHPDAAAKPGGKSQ